MSDDISVEVDASAVVRGLAQLAAGLERASREEGLRQAERTASDIRAAVPVLTGRLVSTVKATPVAGGGAVEYGGNLPYARKIERRTHAVANAVAAAPDAFARTMTSAAEREVARL